MSLDNMVVFNDYVKTTMTEMVAQEVQKFNAASNGAIVLRSSGNDGDFSELASYAKISGLVRRRNAYGSGAVTPANITQLLDRSVKVAAGTPPINIDPNDYNWIQRSPDEAGVVIGTQLAQDSIADMLNTALLSLVPTLAANAGVALDVSAATDDKVSFRNLNKAAGKFGDRATAIAAWIMHSTPFTDLIDTALANAERLFEFGTVRVVADPMGRPLVVTDSPSLVVSGTPNKHATVGLTGAGVVVEENGDFFANTETSNGDENIARTYQAEWSYNLGMKGYAWDRTNGGKSPNDTALGTASNWDKFATSDKDTAGVILLTDADS